MNKKLIAAAMLCACMLTGCANNAESSDASVKTAETTTSAAETTTSAANAETTTTPSAAETTKAPADSTEAAPSETTAAPIQSSENETSVSTTASTTASTVSQTEISAPKSLLEQVKLEQDCSAYIAANKGYTMEEAESCLGSGKDRIYTYSNYILRTYYENGKEILQEINITKSGVKIPSGIEVGMKVSDVIAAHGAPAAEGDYSYDTAYGTVEYRCTGDTIDEIWIY